MKNIAQTLKDNLSGKEVRNWELEFNLEYSYATLKVNGKEVIEKYSPESKIETGLPNFYVIDKNYYIKSVNSFRIYNNDIKVDNWEDISVDQINDKIIDSLLNKKGMYISIEEARLALPKEFIHIVTKKSDSSNLGIEEFINEGYTITGTTATNDWTLFITLRRQ